MKIQLVAENVDPNNFDDSELPTDVHLIMFTKEGKQVCDAVRAYCMTDIFDDYYDKLKGSGVISDIKSGYGRIKPKLFGKIKPTEEKKFHYDEGI
tara:strand:- start:1965 stop:2249 length:285 start_codon:yes stop_codon:yes gene_type:complete